MAQLTNVPSSETTLRVEARKSFPLGIHVFDVKGAPADLTGCVLRMVVKPEPLDVSSDSTNLLGVDAEANVQVPKAGYATFTIQAATLDVAAGEYPFAIVLITSDGLSSVIVKGTMIVEQNTEYSSVGTIFSGNNPSQSLSIYLREAQSINVFVGAQLPPGMNYLRDDVAATIEAFDPDNIAYLPPGGAAGYVMTKVNGDDYATAWRPVGQGQFSLDATGQPVGLSPVSLGDGTWTWDEAGVNADGVTAGYAPVAQGDGTWEWEQVSVAAPDWDAGVGEPGEILNKPTLGTIAERDAVDFVETTTIVSDLAGVHFVTSIPTAVPGEEGHLYFVYTP